MYRICFMHPSCNKTGTLKIREQNSFSAGKRVSKVRENRLLQHLDYV